MNKERKIKPEDLEHLPAPESLLQQLSNVSMFSKEIMQS